MSTSNQITRWYIIYMILFIVSCNQRKAPQSAQSESGHKHTLISTENNVSLSDWSLSSEDLGLKGQSWSVNMVELKGGKQDGVHLIEVDNGRMKLSVIPTRGMSIYSVEYKDIVLGWDSQVKEIVNPKLVNLESNNGLGWLDGFNEWMVRCGIEFAGHPGLDQGRFLTLHGRIGNIPASEVEVIIDETPPYRIRVRGRVNEVSDDGPNLELLTEVSTEPGSNSLRIDDVLTNRSNKDQEFMVIYHGNFGPPLLEQGSQLFGTIEKVVAFDEFSLEKVNNWDIYDAPTLGIAERVNCLYPFADDQGMAHFILQNQSGDKAVSFTYPIDQLPFITQWKNMDSDRYVTGLEPGTGFPHNRSIERKYGRVPILGPGDSRKFNLEYTIHADPVEIKSKIEEIQRIGRRGFEIATTVIDK
ncbi:MAG: aldose 1-epimerase family protein [Bacteroidetes bacterium]|nr:aldose 1-epimerase family protein [Bacteroidota bacterium]